MTSVLSIVQTSLQELGLPYPSSILAADPLQLQCNAILRAAARYLRSQRVFPQQKQKYTLTTVSGQSSYVVPDDYYAALLDTAWDEDKKRRLIGPIADSAMTQRKIGLSGITTDYAYRVFGPDLATLTQGQALIDVNPTPTADGGILSFEYITRNMFIDYTVMLPIAVWRETIGANTDVCLFDDDILIAEFKWRYLRAKKKEYAEEKAEAKAILESAVARLTGTFKGSTTGLAPQPRYSVPDGGWTF